MRVSASTDSKQVVGQIAAALAQGDPAGARAGSAAEATSNAALTQLLVQAIERLQHDDGVQITSSQRPAVNHADTLLSIDGAYIRVTRAKATLLERILDRLLKRRTSLY